MEQQDEIYLVDVWRIFVREWRWFVAMPVLALAGAFAFAHLARPQWEATAWIRLGQVGPVPSGEDPKIEPLLRVIERLKLVPFENEILASAGFAPESREATLYRKSLKLEPMPYAGPLIRMTLRAGSPELATRLAGATVERLRAVQQSLRALPLQAAHARLAQVEDDLKNAQAERGRMLPAATAAPRGDAGPNPLLASMLLAGKDQEIRGLRRERSDLVERLGPTYTYEVSMPWPVYVPRQRAFPNTILVGAVGLMLGLLLGALAALARNAVRRRAAE